MGTCVMPKNIYTLLLCPAIILLVQWHVWKYEHQHVHRQLKVDHQVKRYQHHYTMLELMRLDDVVHQINWYPTIIHQFVIIIELISVMSTFSPISVWSLAGSISNEKFSVFIIQCLRKSPSVLHNLPRSCFKAHASITRSYKFLSKSRPKRIFSFNVVFIIHAVCGT